MAPKCRPSAIRGAPNSRRGSAPEALFGGPRTVQQGRISVSKKLPPTAGGDLRGKTPKNHKKSSCFVFAIEGRPLRDPKTVPEARPGEATIRPQERKRAPQGAPGGPDPHAAKKYRVIYVLPKTSLFVTAGVRRPQKMPPGRNPRRPLDPIRVRAEGPFWRPKKRREHGV